MVDQSPLQMGGETVFDIYPAIDLRKGKVVRLRQGDPGQQTNYGNDPAKVAERWLSAGARWLHVVNLDGAFDETHQENLAALRSILEISALYSAKVQYGGGLRRMIDIEDVIQAGVSRVLLGTAAVESPKIVGAALQKYGSDQIAAALDAREGKVRVRGWKEDSGMAVEKLGIDMYTAGIRTVIYTNIARDGVGSGADIVASVELADKTNLNVIVSGGVKSIEDVIKAKKASVARHTVSERKPGRSSGRISGIIIGRALYDGAVNLEEALKC